MIISQESLLQKQIQTVCKRTTGTFSLFLITLKVANMVESLEQELNNITDSGDFAAYQVDFSSSLNLASIVITKIAMLCPPGVSDKLLWNPPSPQSFSTHHCKKESDTISVLQVSYTFDQITLTLLISLSLSLSSLSLAWRLLAVYRQFTHT